MRGSGGTGDMLFCADPSAFVLHFVCNLSPKLKGIDGFRPNLHRYIIRQRERTDSTLVTLTLFSKSPEGIED